MLRLLIDQGLDHLIRRGLLLRVPNLDVITAHRMRRTARFAELRNTRMGTKGFVERKAQAIL